LSAHARSIAVAIGAAILVAACGGSATLSDPSPTATTAAASEAAAPTTNAAAWTVTDKSKATIRVREQLVGVGLPSDAVLTATGAKGSFALNADGTFAPGSKITFDLATLSSDESGRDNFIKRDTLQVSQFPRAEFVPTKTSGLTLPLQTSGTFTFTLTGNMTMHGQTNKEVFDVQGKVVGNTITGTATSTIYMTDFGIQPPNLANIAIAQNKVDITLTFTAKAT